MDIENIILSFAIDFNRELSFYSDVVRYLLLHNYGGTWFDLDCFILRSFDPIFSNFENEICVYQWENQNYPNGAIFVSLEPRSEKMRKNIEFIIQRNRGWGFQEAGLTYDLPLSVEGSITEALTWRVYVYGLMGAYASRAYFFFACRYFGT